MVPGEGAPWACDWQASEIKIVSQPWICSCHFESKIRIREVTTACEFRLRRSRDCMVVR
jgi:hypothetical protein